MHKKEVPILIEIIYKGEDEAVNKELEIKLPKNIRQIGECEHSKRIIYVEDFVMTYVNHFNSQNLKYGVLLGNIQRGNGHTYIFITGAVTANALLDNELVFDEDVWTGIYEEIKLYFENVEIVGWFASMPSLLNNDFPGIEKLHIDHFAGDDRVCFLIDREEGDENFFLYEQGGMKKSDGFFIYYEKNMDMQSYMTMHVDKRNIPEDYQQTHKRGMNVKVHDLIFRAQEEEKEEAEPERGMRKFMKQLPSFAYSASSFMLIAVLAGTVAMMNASGQLKELKTVVNGLVGKEQVTTGAVADAERETVKVVEVEGEVTKQEVTEQPTQSTQSPMDASTQEVIEQITESESTTEAVSEPVTESPTTTKPEDSTSREEQVPSQTETSTEQIATEQITTEQVTEPVNAQVYYVIEKGDSLYDISLKKYGTISMIEAIAKANNLQNENLIQEGETIVLP
jgi:hypothetical protein